MAVERHNRSCIIHLVVRTNHMFGRIIIVITLWRNYTMARLFIFKKNTRCRFRDGNPSFFYLIVDGLALDRLSGDGSALDRLSTDGSALDRRSADGSTVNRRTADGLALDWR